jgi:hypothetical protein
MSLACATAVAADPAPGHHRAPRAKAMLDLRAPPLSHVLSRTEIASLTADRDDVTESVTVDAQRSPVPCCGTFIALPWAILHPTQAWQIVTPYAGPCGGTWCTEP